MDHFVMSTTLILNPFTFSDLGVVDCIALLTQFNVLVHIHIGSIRPCSTLVDVLGNGADEGDEACPKIPEQYEAVLGWKTW
jgi:hypothetical protein